GRTEGNQSLMQGHPVQDRTHCVFAHTEMEVASLVLGRLEIAKGLDISIGGGRQIRRSAHESGSVRENCCENLSRGLARRNGLGFGDQRRNLALPVLV